jgi:ADP-heptose:LPS heptosyltransferase
MHHPNDKTQPENILVVRNDKLGDFMLAWPSFRLLKERLPGVQVTALVRAYTREAAELCPWIDAVLLDPGSEAGRPGTRHLIARLRERQFDAVVTLFSTTRIAWACWRAGIRYRLAPATKVAQLLYNHRLAQRRSRSEKPEWAYNLDLAARLLRDHGVDPGPVPAAPFLRFPVDETAALQHGFRTAHQIPAGTRLVFVHPGSGGSAVNLGLHQYATLLTKLESTAPLAFVVTAGPGEAGRANELAERLDKQLRVVFVPDGVREFARHIAFADLWISGSTGPLHIAGALDRPTAAFYPSRRSATPLRWQTLNSPERRLAFHPPSGAGETDMGSIDLDAAAAAISARLLR